MRGPPPSGSQAARFGALADEFEAALERHVVDAWFPRCVDTEAGGFIEDFDRQWRRGSLRGSLLEFQARQTRVAAKLALRYPEDGRFPEYALHGLRCLRDRMWDGQHGGWFWQVDGRGAPQEGGTKHSHAAAYAVQSAALVFQATGDADAREHAQEALAWYDRHAHDKEFGGFHNWLTRTGEVIRTKADVPSGAGRLDPMGHEIGLKDVNVHGDWFETLLDYCASIDSPRARELLVETTDIYLHKAIAQGGEVHYAFYPDWTPTPGVEWYGYGFEATHRFLAGARALPEFPELESRAGVIARHALRRARVPGGGFCFAGLSGGSAIMEGHDTRVPQQSWWVNFEGLRVLALYAVREAEPGPYTRALERHWKYVRERFIDEKYGGIYSGAGAGSFSWRHPLHGDGWSTRKARPWKDASHETGCLLESIDVLRAASTR